MIQRKVISYGIMDNKIKICSLNVNGIGAKHKRIAIFDFLHLKKSDISFIQEAHIINKNVKFWKSEYGGEILHSSGEANARGVMILINKRIFNMGKILKWEGGLNGRLVICDLQLDERTFTLVNVYGPNDDDKEFYVEVVKKMSEFACENVIFGGDFNLVMNIEMDAMNRKESHRHAKMALNKIIEEYDLIDIWRVNNNDKRMYTWQKCVNRGEVRKVVGSRLDFFLINLGLGQNVTKCNIEHGFCTDHSLINLEITLDSFKRGPGIWRLNNQHLEDEKYIEKINETIDKHNKSLQHLGGCESWEILKLEMKRISQQFSKEKALKKSKNKKRIIELLNEINEEIGKDPTVEKINNKKKIEDMLDEITEAETRKHVFLSVLVGESGGEAE